MLANIKTNLLLIAILCCGLPAAAQTDDDALATIERNLPAVRTFEYGQNSNALVDIEKAVFALSADSAVRAAAEGQLIAALESAETTAGRQFLCTQLRVLGTDKSIPAVAKLLANPDVSSAAIYALGRLESAQVDEALLQAMSEAQGATQAGIINAIADRRYQAAQPAVLKLMQATDSSVVKQACARALGRLGGSEAVGLLLTVSREATGALALEVQNALLEAGDAMLAAGEQEQAANTYNAVLQLKPAPQVHLAALRGVVRALPDKAPAILSAEILRQDSSLGRDAIALTALAPGPTATKAFAALLDKLDTPNQILMLRALGQRSDSSASAALVAAANSDDPSVRLAALEALGGSGGADCVSLLLQAAAEQGASALVARRSLLLVPDKAIDQRLIRLLATGNGAVTAEAARAVAGRGVEEAVPQLMKLATAANEMARREAITALGELATQQELPPMIAMAVASKSTDDQSVLAEAVARVIGRSDADDRVTPVLAALRTAPDTAKPTLILILGKTGSPQALAAIRDGVKNRSAAVQTAAVNALAQWPEASVSDDLLDVIRTARDRAQKELALQGYLRLANLTDDPTSMFVTVLKQVTSVGDRKLVLEGLGQNADSPAAMELAMQYLDDRALAPAAGLATLRIAHQLRNSHSDAARAALDQVLEKVDHDDVRRRAQEVVNDMEKFADHILQWEGVGPFMEEGKDGAAIYQMVFDPEQPDAQDVKWKLVTKGIGTWDINLEAEFGGYDHCGAYLRTRVWSRSAQEALMEMGSDDAVKTWLNGQLVFDKWTVQGSAPRQHQVKVSLKQGWNLLMLKAVDWEGGWVVACRLRAPDGSALEGLKIAVE